MVLFSFVSFRSEKYYFFILVFCFYCQLFQSSTMASPVDSDEPKIPDESEYDWENFKVSYFFCFFFFLVLGE